MSFEVRTWPASEFAAGVAETIGESLPTVGTFVLTGGRTAALVYQQLAHIALDWSGVEIFFSDERCVPPTDDNSNYKMVSEKLLAEVEPGEVFRIRGEDPPDVGAATYNSDLAAVESGFDLMMLGMGAEGHIGALFPGSDVLTSTATATWELVGQSAVTTPILCAAVHRPDGMRGITMTPRALLMAKKIYIVERGDEKAEAVAQAVKGHAAAHAVPVRVLADHPDVTFLIDEAAASHL
ncbi:MAG: 6-phosphogluconolactonase [Actinomycetota bacterium]